MRVMRVRMTPESHLCAYTKNVLFSSSVLLDQRSLQLINKALINCKNRWSNKAEQENRTFFVYAHNCDSGVMRTRIRFVTVQIEIILDNFRFFWVTISSMYRCLTFLIENIFVYVYLTNVQSMSLTSTTQLKQK